MKTYVHLWYLAHFFLEWEMFQSCRENQNIHLYNFIFRKLHRLWDNVEKYGIAWQTTDNNITERMRIILCN
jgi:hypothetical protein